MSRECVACQHPMLEQINDDLRLHRASYRALATKYGLSDRGIRRHERKCLHNTIQQSKELRMMYSAQALAKKALKWEKRMTRQYRNAEAQGDIYAAVATERAGVAALLAANHIARDATIVEADPATMLPPAFEPDTLRIALRTLIEAGVATMPTPTDAAHQEEESTSGQATDSAAS